MLDNVLPLDHKYVPPAGNPVAVIVADAPEQIVWFVLVIVGVGFTVTVEVDAGDVHPFKV